MKVEIINTPLRLGIHGFSGTALNKDYAGTAFKLSSRMWEIIKLNNLKNKGINIWVYEPNDLVFTGVELEVFLNTKPGLNKKTYGYKNMRILNISGLIIR